MRFLRPSKEAPSPPDSQHQALFGMEFESVEFQGTTFFVPGYAAHVAVAQRILSGSLVSRQLHRLTRDVLVHRPGSMVHAGAFFGDMLTSFSRKTPGTVYAFEPVLENYLFAHKTAAANGLTNVLLFHAGLGSQNSVVQIETEHRRDGRHRGGSAFIIQPRHDDPPLNTQPVPLLTVDQFAISDLSLIQLDVEGYEQQVLHGAEQSIARNRPVIVIEDKHHRCDELMSSWRYVEVRRIGLDRVYLPEEQLDDLLSVVGGVTGGLEATSDAASRRG